MSEAQKDFDLLDIPLEGVAAYWLSLKKLVGNKRNFKSIAEEAEYTSEPYVRHLLDIGFQGYGEERVRLLAKAKADVMVETFARCFDLMRIAVLDVATGENPHRSLAKMVARFPVVPVSDEKAVHLAQELVKLVPEHQAGKEKFFNVSHRSQDDKLLVTLLFYVLYSRHQGKMACVPLLEYVQSRFFRDALSMVIDGFDAPFVRKWCKEHKAVMLADVERKIALSTELCLAIARREDYDDVFRMARAFMR